MAAEDSSQSEPLELTISVDRAENLFNADTGVMHRRKDDVSDPYVVVYWARAQEHSAWEAASSEGKEDASEDGDADATHWKLLGKDKKSSSTPVVKDSLSPSWEHEFETAEVPDVNTYLKFEVWDRDSVGSDDYLGEAVLAVWEHVFENDSEESVWLQLSHSTKMSRKLKWKPQGSLRVTLTPHTLPDECFDDFHLIGFPAEKEMEGWSDKIGEFLDGRPKVAAAMLASAARAKDRHRGKQAMAAAARSFEMNFCADADNKDCVGDLAKMESRACELFDADTSDRLLTKVLEEDDGNDDDLTGVVPTAVAGSPAAMAAEGVPDVTSHDIVWHKNAEGVKQPVLRVRRVNTRVFKGADGHYRSSKLLVGGTSQLWSHSVSALPKREFGSGAALPTPGGTRHGIASSSTAVASSSDADAAASSSSSSSSSSDEAKPVASSSSSSSDESNKSKKPKNPFETPKDPPSAHSYDWSNWGDTIFVQYRRQWRPRTLIDVRKAIADARQARATIRCVAHAHSWAPVFSDTGNDIMFMEELVGLWKNFGDQEEDWEVTALAGTTTGDLSALMRKNGVYLPTNVISKEFQVGGIITTGSHGSGWSEGLILDSIKRIEVVDSDTKLRTFTRDDPNWKYAVLNLGLFGILYSVTFTVLAERHRALNIDYTIDQQRFWAAHPDDPSKDIWRRQLHDSHYLELFWFPYNKDMWVKVWNFTERQPKWRPLQKVWRSFEEWAQAQVGRAANPLVASKDAHWPKKMRFFSALTPAYSRAAFKMIAQSFGTLEEPKYEVSSIQDAIHWRGQLDALPLWNCEIAFNLPELADGSTDFEPIRRAWLYIVEITEKLAAADDPDKVLPGIGNKWPMNITLECRFGRDTVAWLGNNRGNHKTAFLEWVTGLWTPGWDVFCDHIIGWVVENCEHARVHWAKYQQDLPNVIEGPLHRGMHADTYDEFARVREELGVDPDNMFTNAWFRSIFKLPEPYSNRIQSGASSSSSSSTAAADVAIVDDDADDQHDEKK